MQGTDLVSLLHALRQQPHDAQRRYQAAAALLAAGHVQQAQAIAAPLVEVLHSHPVVLSLDGDLRAAAGDINGAEAAYRRAAASDPACAAAHNGLGNLLFTASRTAEAAAAYRAALAARPGTPDVMVNLGRCLVESGAVDEGLPMLEAGAAASGVLQHQLAAWSTVPVIAGDAAERARWGERVCAGLRRLSAQLDTLLAVPAGRAAAADAVGNLFFTHYLGTPDRPRADLHGAVLHRIMAATFPGMSRRGCPRRVGRQRVVFASECFRDHTVSKLFWGWIEDLPRDRLDVRIVHLGSRADRITRELGALAPLEHVPGPLDGAVAALAALEADVIVWPDLGMGSRSLQLAAIGLAPVQLVGWGHPVATGLPTIDGILSSAAMEPPGGDAHYRAPVHRLPGIGIRPQRPWASPAAVGRAALGLPESAPLALCAQSLFKLHPEDDEVFARLLAAAPAAHLAVVRLEGDEATAAYTRRLGTALARHRVDPRRVHVLPRQPLDRWLALNRCADVVLDARHWSGGLSTLEALSVGAVPVTRWGDRMRARHTAGILSALGVPELIGRSDDGYISIAARLLGAPAERAALSARLRAGMERLHADPAPGAALAALLSR